MYKKRPSNGNRGTAARPNRGPNSSNRTNNNRRPNRGGNRSGGNRGKSGSRGKQFIHESKFINRDVVQPTAEVEAHTPTHASFAEFRLVEPLQKNIASLGFETPSAIQDQTIQLGLDGKDIIGLANTGTGKTAAFLLPIINRLYRQRVQGSVLIMAPTRELADQIDQEFRKFARDMKLYSVLLVGGVNIGPQFRSLQRRPHVIIGTPGRIKDHIERGSLTLINVNTFVLDEADRMLDMGFVNDIRQIASFLPANRQTMCFSATFSDAVRKITDDFMSEPQLVSVKKAETSDHIHQDVVHYSDNQHKKDLLLSLLADDALEKVIIFGETKFGVQRLSDTIEKKGISSRAIHGNKSQGQRNRALADFKTSKARVLVATDVAARGLDVPNVSHVINFDTPTTYDDYVHRIGRTGRGGKVGAALTFVQKK